MRARRETATRGLRLWLLAGLLCAFGSSGRADSAIPTVQIEGGEAETHDRIMELVVGASGSPDPVDPGTLRLELLGLLAREGYWGAKISGPLEEESGPQWRIRLGSRWVVDSVRVSPSWDLAGAPEDSLEERAGGDAYGSLLRSKGWMEEATRVEASLAGLSPPRAGPIGEGASALLTYLEENAHPFARVVPKDPVAKDGGLDLTLEVQPGPTVLVTEVDFRGEHKSRPSYLRRLLRLSHWEPRPYEESFWVEGTKRLRASGHFTDVLGPQIEVVEAPQDTSLSARIVYELREGVSNQLEAAAGYSGQSKTLSGLVNVSLGNLWGTGRAFQLQWERREADRTSFHLRYEEPYIWRLPIQWRVEIQHVLEDTFYTRTDLRGVVAWEIEERLWMDAGLRSERSIVPESLGGGRSRVSSLFGLRWEGIGKDPSLESGFGASILWSRGQTRAAEGEGLRETVDAVEFRSEIRGRLPILGLGRLRILGAGRFLDEPIPLFETYGVGGARTLRGYREEEFRALRYGIFQLEAGPRLGPGGSRFLLFVDAGWLLRWEREAPVQGRRGPVTLRGSYGLGLRSLSRRGLVRIDYGVPWGGDPTSGRLHVALEAPF